MNKYISLDTMIKISWVFALIALTYIVTSQVIISMRLDKIESCIDKQLDLFKLDLEWKQSLREGLIQEAPQEEVDDNIDIAPEEKDFKITIEARVTAYAPFDNKSGICADSDPNSTSTGTVPRRGVIAVDPRKIPYGTKLYIPGYGEAVAEDTGGALRRYDGVAIDVMMDTYEEAMEWGKQYLEVEIIEWGGEEDVNCGL